MCAERKGISLTIGKRKSILVNYTNDVQSFNKCCMKVVNLGRIRNVPTVCGRHHHRLHYCWHIIDILRVQYLLIIFLYVNLIFHFCFNFPAISQNLSFRRVLTSLFFGETASSFNHTLSRQIEFINQLKIHWSRLFGISAQSRYMFVLTIFSNTDVHLEV
jgi:hypothetical protein